MNPELSLVVFKFATGLFSFAFITFLFRGLGQGREKEKNPLEEKWQGLESLEIIDIFEENDEIKTLRLKRLQGKIPHYKPGQFVSFEIPVGGKVFRSYSLSGSAENRNFVQISIKKIASGVGSSWFHDLRVGDRVRAYRPKGLFTDAELGSEMPRLFLAGGIGITPLLSMVLTAIDRGQKHTMTLIYGAKTQVDLVFHHQLLELSKRHKNFTYIPILSNESPDVWSGLRGLINADLIKPHLFGKQQPHIYFCGPAPMKKSVVEILNECNISEKYFHKEEFVSPVPFSIEQVIPQKLVISLNGKAFDYQGKTNLLEFFESQGIELSFACRSGVCGACKVKCVEGRVRSATNSGLDESEQETHILTCVSWPLEQLKLES